MQDPATVDCRLVFFYSQKRADECIARLLSANDAADQFAHFVDPAYTTMTSLLIHMHSLSAFHEYQAKAEARYVASKHMQHLRSAPKPVQAAHVGHDHATSPKAGPMLAAAGDLSARAATHKHTAVDPASAASAKHPQVSAQKYVAPQLR